MPAHSDQPVSPLAQWEKQKSHRSFQTGGIQTREVFLIC